MGCSDSLPVDAPQQVNVMTLSKDIRLTESSYIQLEKQSSGTYVCGSRGKMKLQVQGYQNFLSHHLENEIHLSPFASSRKIRARQIVEHLIFNDISHSKVGGNLSTSKLTEFAMKAWFQRTFIECIRRAEKSYFQQDKSYDTVREQLAQEYIFQIYQMGEFINAGFGKFSSDKKNIEVPLSFILLNSDSALYPLLARLQEKYPLVDNSSNIAFPSVEIINKNINLLTLFPSKSYSDPQHLNIQTLMHDLKFLIDDANNVFENFRKDMVQLLGEEVLTDCKVKRIMKDGKSYYNASAVRRVFIKWSETLMERIPGMFVLPQFAEFIRSKKRMANHFIFKSTVSPTTHQQVIECLSELLESVKYQLGSHEPRQEFGLFLYDLLRCKAIRKTGQQVVELLEVLKKTNVTISGQKFEVVRIKNRFKNATRDLLINFRYGEHLVGQAQLCIDVPHDTPLIGKKIKFRHYLYELERGLFGPTFQLIMQYEDFARKDIVVDLEADGRIQPRQSNQRPAISIKKAGRSCPQGHEMISIKGNVFEGQKLGELTDQDSGETGNCDYCFEDFPLNRQYHYCYYCTLFYCLRCLPIYNSIERSKIELVCTRTNLLTALTSHEQIAQKCKQHKSIVIVCYRYGSPSSRLFLDQIIYLLSAYASQESNIPPIFSVNLGDAKFSKTLQQYQITRIPSTFVLDQMANPQVLLVGCTFHDIQSLFEVQQRIVNGLSKGLKLKCEICNEMMDTEGDVAANSDEKCQICWDSNKIEDVGDLIRAIKLNNKDFVCKNGHVRCGYCAYLSNNTPSSFRDHTGRSYLSNKILFKPPMCSNHHLMKLQEETESFQCSKCKQSIEISRGEIIGHCSICDERMCIQCIQDAGENFQEKHLKQKMKVVEIVSHFVESKAEQAHPCGCGKMFLKVYESRKIDDNPNASILKGLLTGMKSNSWTCRVCQHTSKKLKLHLACFNCSNATSKSKLKFMAHTEICMNCGIKSGLIGRTQHVKTEKKLSNLKCPVGHKTYLTSLKTDELSFSCINCKNYFYPTTQRYDCLQCSSHCCLACSETYLTIEQPLTTSKVCDKSHPLKLVKTKPALQFCKKCVAYLKDSHFCCQECDYYLCQVCSKK